MEHKAYHQLLIPGAKITGIILLSHLMMRI